MINKIAIIIIVFNGSKWIKKCLASVFESEYKNYDVIIIDNASTDNSAQIVEKEFPQVQLIYLNKNIGFGKGNNIGIRKAMEAGCDAVVLLNPDTEVQADWLDELVKASNPNDVGIAQAMLLLGESRALTNNVGNAMHYLGFGFVKHYKERVDKWYHKEPFEIGYASGAAMLIKREVLVVIASECTHERGNPVTSAQSDEHGIASVENTLPRNDMEYFDAKLFMYNDDQDFCWRARLAGYKIIIAPKAIVYHYYEFSRNKLKFYWNERNRWILLLQNYSARTLFLIFPILVIIEFMMFVYSLIGGWFMLKLKSYFWILSNMDLISKQRKQVQKMRLIKDSEIVEHMDAKLEFSEVDNVLLKHVVSPIVENYFKIIKNFV